MFVNNTAKGFSAGPLPANAKGLKVVIALPEVIVPDELVPVVDW